MFEEFLTKVIVYTPEATAKALCGSGCCPWPWSAGALDRRHERAFLTWFYERSTADPSSISESSIQETLRTFCGSEGVLGSRCVSGGLHYY